MNSSSPSPFLLLRIFSSRHHLPNRLLSFIASRRDGERERERERAKNYVNPSIPKENNLVKMFLRNVCKPCSVFEAENNTAEAARYSDDFHQDRPDFKICHAWQFFGESNYDFHRNQTHKKFGMHGQFHLSTRFVISTHCN